VFSRDVSTSRARNGLLRSAPGAGAVIVALLLHGRPFNRRVGPTLFLAVGTFGGAHARVRASRSYILSLAALAGWRRPTC